MSEGSRWKQSIITVLVVIGAVFLSIGLYFLFDNIIFRFGATPTDGIIVKLQKMRIQGQGEGYAVIFRFFDAVGREYEVRSQFYSHPPAGRVGDHIKVLYRRYDPKDARIDSFGSPIVFPLVFVGVGVALSVIGYFAKRSFSKEN